MTREPNADDPAGMDDPAAVVQRSRGEPEAFGVIFNRYVGEIFRYVAYRLGPAAAEDVVAETFVAAFGKRGRYDPRRASVRTWLYGIATNLIGKHRRSEVRALRALGRVTPDHADDGHEERVAARVSAATMTESLARAISALNTGERDVLLLVALAGLRHEEIASALGIPYGTVGSRLNRARSKLRKALGGTNPLLEIEENVHG